MPALVWHHETPIPESSIYAQWCLYRAARKKHIKVLLVGQGADELFGGYLTFLAARARFDSRHDPFGGLLAMYGLIRQLLALPASLSSVRRFVRPRGHRANVVAGMVPNAPPLVRERDMRIADLITWSLPNLLSWQDRSSMAHGVEARLPFLDPNLLAIGLSAPSKLLYHRGRTKYPIRMIAARLGEPEVAWRWGKIPFASEEKAWMRARALRDNGTRSSLWSTFETGGAAGELRRLADAGEPRALVRRLAIDEFLRTFWPDAVDGRSSSATGVSETVRR